MEKKKIALIDRRTFLLGGVAAIGGTMLAGCSGARSEEPVLSGAPESEGLVQDAAVPDSEPEQEVSAAAAPRSLLVYFSRAGMNYASGGPVHTDVGNTAVVAEFIQDAIDCDVYEITAENPYPYEYEATTDQAMREQNEGARPAIAGELPDISGYDTLVVGSGVWWGDPPMIMHTFFEAVDTAGKTIVPFTTHAGSGLGSAVATYRELCPEAEVKPNGLAVSGERARDVQAQVEAWAAELALA